MASDCHAAHARSNVAPPIKLEDTFGGLESFYPARSLPSDQDSSNVSPNDTKHELPRSSHGFSSSSPAVKTFITHNPESWRASIAAKSQEPEEFAPVAGMTMAEYTNAMRVRPLASAADRPGTAPVQGKDRSKRAKTGCYTCRKRRIKCDERLPTCRNCEKKGRECRGYDPNNRPDPAWTSLPDPASTSAIANYGTPNAPQPSSPLGAKRKRGSKPRSTNSARKKTKARTLSPSSSVLDPALSDAVPAPMAAPLPQQAAGAPYNAAFAQNVHAHVSAIPQDAQNRGTSAHQSSLRSPAHSHLENRNLKIEDLYLMGGVDPPTPRVEQPLSPEAMDEIKELYMEEYAPGMDEFLETRWYTNSGLRHLLEDNRLVEMFAGMAEIFRTTTSSNFEVMHKLPSTEARVVWHLLCLVRKAATCSDSESPILPAERQEITHLIARLAIFEHLVTNRVLDANPLSAMPPVQFASVQQSRQYRFWTLLGDFVASPDAQGRPAPEHALASMRGLLDRLENRDVLYSMAVARHYGARTADFPDRLTPGTHSVGLHAPEKSQLIVATRFLENEASGNGTNQVVMRLCGMARRSWAWIRSSPL